MGVMATPNAQPFKTARQQLGEVIRHYRERRSWTLTRLSKVTSASVGTIEAWERGEAVPDGNAWKGLKSAVNHSLGEYGELRQRALLEQDAADAARKADKEKRMEKTNGNSIHTLGDKLGAALPNIQIAARPVAPPPVVLAPASDARTVTPGQPVTYHNAPPEQAHDSRRKPTASEVLGQPVRGIAVDGRALSPIKPPGATSRSAIAERERFIRGVLLQRPDIGVHGKDGLLELLWSRFGVGITPSRIDRIREELKREAIKEEVRREMAAPAAAPSPPPIPVAAPAAVVESKPASPDNIAAAVQLILEAVPNLKTFTITVDESGEASCDYTERKVQIVETAGSIKVRR